MYQCRHFEAAKNFTDKVSDLHWAMKGMGAYRDQDRTILIAEADIKRPGLDGRPDA